MRNSWLVQKMAVLFVVTLVLIGTEYAGAELNGYGTEDSPYLINDVNDLQMLAGDSVYFSGYSILTADIDCSGVDGMNLIIAKDSDNSNEDYDGPSFTGTLNGDYHVIENLTINAASSEDYLGLFGMIETGALVQNLGLVNASITCGDTSIAVGVLAGGNSGNIDECYAAGVINGGATSMGLGGLVGFNGYFITNSHANVQINGGANTQYAGGLVGNNAFIIVGSYARGMVTGQAFVGGLAGDNYMLPMVEACYYLDPLDGGGPINMVGAVLTAQEMADPNSFVSWDFLGDESDGLDEMWVIVDGFPVFAWQKPVGLLEMAMLSQYWQMDPCAEVEACSRVDWFVDGSIGVGDLEQLAKSWLEPTVVIHQTHPGDDFETGDFTNNDWAMSGNGWVIDSSDSYEGTYSARSGATGDSQISSMEFTTNTNGNNYIRFYMKTSSQADRDKLKFYIDGAVAGTNFYGSGELGWSEISFPIGSGSTHTFRWAYEKDGSGSSGADSVWIDKIVVFHN
jgi:hypothetical protein